MESQEFTFNLVLRAQSLDDAKNCAYLLFGAECKQSPHDAFTLARNGVKRILEVLDEELRETRQPELVTNCLESSHQRVKGLERIQLLQAFVLLAVGQDEVGDVCSTFR